MELYFTQFLLLFLSVILLISLSLFILYFNFEISIVQPGLSVSSLTKDHSSLLGSADNYIRELTGRQLRVFASK